MRAWRSGRFGLAGAAIGGLGFGLGDLGLQLYQNGGRLACVSWGEVGGAALFGAGVGLVGELVLPLLLEAAPAGELAEGLAAAEEAPALEIGADQSWGNPNSLADHFAAHGADFGATNEAGYADQAAQFFQESQAEGLPTQVDANGTIRVYDPDTNTFGAYNANGTTRTFFKPSSPTYWGRQPGSPPIIVGGQ